MKQFYLITCLFLTGCSEKPYVGQNELKKEKEKPTQAPIKEHTFNEEKQFRDIFEKARSGDAQAQLDLSVRYWSGGTEEGVFPRNLKKSIQWMSLAAENGNSSAQFELAECYQKGMGLPQNSESAMRWYGKAADQGLARALGKIGDMYFYGLGVPIDYDEAFACYEKGAVHSDFYSANQLASCYNEGLGTEIDLLRAFAMYKQSWLLAEQQAINKRDDSCAAEYKYSNDDEMNTSQAIIRCNYATCLLSGGGVPTPPDFEEGVVQLIESAKQRNYLAILYLKDMRGCSNEKIRKAFESGDVPDIPDQVDKPKTKLRAYEIYRPTTRKPNDDGGSTAGKFNQSGYRSWYGYGVKRDRHCSISFFEKAAELNDPEGMRNAGLAGLELQNYEEQAEAETRWPCIKQIKKAAQMGDPRAIALMETPYYQGLYSDLRMRGSYNDIQNSSSFGKNPSDRSK